MATIIKEVEINATPERVWDAVADFSQIHERLMPGIMSDARMEGEYRVLTLVDGRVLRERFISSDAQLKRLAYSVESDRLEHHNASLQVFNGPANTARLVWTVDLLPDTVAAAVSDTLEASLKVAKDFLSKDSR